MLPLPARRALQLSLLFLGLALLGSSCDAIDVVYGVPRTDGSLPVEIRLQSGQDPAATRVFLSTVDVTSRFTPGPGRLVGTIPLPPPGPATLAVRAAGAGQFPIDYGFPFVSPAAAPALAGVDPVPSAGMLPRTAWLRLRFNGSIATAALDGTAFGIECNGAVVPRRLSRVGSDALVLDPTPSLPASASCRVAWRGPTGSVQQSSFTTPADASVLARVLHDRENPQLVAPFPDDYYAVTDASKVTGKRLAIDVPPYTGTLFQVYDGLLHTVNGLDGFSRVAPIVIPFSHPIDPSLTPSDEFASQDPFAAIALFDLDPASPDYGKRIPYALRYRTDSNVLGQVDYSVTLFPSIALRPRGQYAVVVTQRLFADSTPGQPLRGSTFFERVAGPAQPGDSAAVIRARASIAPVLSFLETVPAVPIAREDVALALRISIRSDDTIPNDLLAIKEMTLANPPPPLTITSVQSLGVGGAILRGTVRLPTYLDGFFQIAHDPTTGKPVATGSEDVPFVLRLPPPTSAGPAPIVMYQHGNPGSPEEIASNSLNGYLANNGFAIGGIRDYINRRLGDPDAQIQATFFFVLSTKAVPAFWNQTGADMIGFLRALQGLGGVAWRPATAPQAPLLDTTRLFYHGISEGGNNALRFLPFAPEFIAATPTVGGGRLTEVLLHQYPTLLQQLEGFIPGVRPVQTLTGLALFQAAYDAQDPHSFARFVNRAPLVFPSLPGARPPSILWTEGIGDTFVPNNATRSAARELGIPTMRKLRHASPVLTEVDGPLRANIAPDRTSAHFQYDPATTPGCSAGGEGHYCPQTSPAAQQQRLHFFQTALQGPAPEIVDPIP